MGDGVWLAGPYFIDFDSLNQLRMAGPANHLFYGSVGLYRDNLTELVVEAQDGQAKVSGIIKSTQVFWPDPAMGHIRRIRHLVERSNRTNPTYAQVREESPGEIDPGEVLLKSIRRGHTVTYRRRYGRWWYGCDLTLPAKVRIERDDHRGGFQLASIDYEIPFKLTTVTNLPSKPGINRVVMPMKANFEDFGALAQPVQRLAERARSETEYLVKYNKTSGFEYGTIFPRDWVESMDLGGATLMPSAKRYMLHKALELVGTSGEAWHENIVGEFAHEREQTTQEVAGDLSELVGQSGDLAVAIKNVASQLDETQVLRSMIDIEPRYLLTLQRLNPKDFSKSEFLLLGRVAKYILDKSRAKSLITFKELPALLKRYKSEAYYPVGNWRDSRSAFKQIHPVVAPYDVNAVFYPAALIQIKRASRLLGLAAAEVADIDELIAKWLRVKSWYAFTNRDGTSAYALALYDIKDGNFAKPRFKQLRVNHLDEAYDLFFGEPTQAELESFCQRLLSPHYFWTQSGPTLVGQRDGYKTTDYHGRVIWTKQTAICIAGLERQLQKPTLPAPLKLVMKQALHRTAEASLLAFLKLRSAPELHYDLRGQPRFYSDQPATEGPMNKVQLWSAVGALRIIEAYAATK